MENEKRKGKVLFIHHGGIAGGAPLSMLYTMKGAREAGYEPLAALRKPMPELHQLYNCAGFKTVETPWVPMFITWSGSEGKWWNPIMWKGLYKAFKKWKSGKEKLLALLKEEAVDLVHLNSVGLSNSAEALMEVDFPFIWHVREHGPNRKGYRFKRISSRVARAAHVIFLSRAERDSWIGNAKNGTVVHNFVDIEKFDNTKYGAITRNKFGINEKTKVVLYVGGSKAHKGVIELLGTLGQLKRSYGDDFVCLMPDSEVKNPKQPTRIEREIAKLIENLGLERNCKLLPFNPDIVDLFAACDVLVFPATKPHFARPVIEASAMGKPVIAFDLKAVDELIKNEETGYLVPVRDRNILKDKIEFIFKNPDVAARMGIAGKKFALEKFEQRKQMDKILALYKKALQV